MAYLGMTWIRRRWLKTIQMQSLYVFTHSQDFDHHILTKLEQFLQNEGWVDPQRIATWGFFYSSGIAFEAAAFDESAISVSTS